MARRDRRVSRVVGGLLVALLTALAGALPAPPATAAQAQARRDFSMTDPFAREVVRPGAKDVDPWHIAHVYDVQYRLRWLGRLDVAPRGIYGKRTKAAVIAFQRARGLDQTGVVDHATWPVLIRRTVRGRAHIPAGCHGTGWHYCYDRRRHQATLFHNGALYNSWMVRGGGTSTRTRTGRFRVYWRDVDHVSSIFGSPMPYSQFFSGGEAIHGSRMMMDPWVGHSHGCVNMWVEDARQLWRVTNGHRLVVHVYGRWS